MKVFAKPKEIYYVEPVNDEPKRHYYSRTLRRLYSRKSYVTMLKKDNPKVPMRVWRVKEVEWELIEDGSGET